MVNKEVVSIFLLSKCPVYMLRKQKEFWTRVCTTLKAEVFLRDYRVDDRASLNELLEMSPLARTISALSFAKKYSLNY